MLLEGLGLLPFSYSLVDIDLEAMFAYKAKNKPDSMLHHGVLQLLH